MGRRRTSFADMSIMTSRWNHSQASYLSLLNGNAVVPVHSSRSFVISARTISIINLAMLNAIYRSIHTLSLPTLVDCDLSTAVRTASTREQQTVFIKTTTCHQVKAL